jgi:sugar phosphate isomerase/epimerase
MSQPWTLAGWVDEELAHTLPHLVRRGFTHIALAARIDRPVADLEALADAGVIVACARLSGDLTLADVEARREQLRLLKRQVDDAALLGATLTWLSVDAIDREQQKVFVREGIELLAAHAQARQVQLGVEGIDVPGTGVVLRVAGEWEVSAPCWSRNHGADSRRSPGIIRAAQLTPALAAQLQALAFGGVLIVDG